MNTDEIIQKLQELRDLQNEAVQIKEEIEGTDLLFNYDPATDAEKKLSELLSEYNRNIKFPKLLTRNRPGITDSENQSPNNSKFRFDVYDFMTKDGLSAFDINAFKEEFVDAFLEMEKKSENYKKEYYVQKQKIIEGAKAEVEQSKEYGEKRKKDLSDRLDAINERINSNELIHQKYVFLVPKIIEILDERRATSLTDALNLAIKEHKEEEYFAEKLKIEKQKLEELQRKNDLEEEEQIRRNEILEEELESQRQMQMEHQRQMEEYARQQSEAAEEQIRIAKEQARQQAERDKEMLRKQKNEEFSRKLDEKFREDGLKWATRQYEKAAEAYNRTGSSYDKSRMDSAFAEMQKYK